MNTVATMDPISSISSSRGSGSSTASLLLFAILDICPQQMLDYLTNHEVRTFLSVRKRLRLRRYYCPRHGTERRILVSTALFRADGGGRGDAATAPSAAGVTRKERICVACEMKNWFRCEVCQDVLQRKHESFRNEGHCRSCEDSFRCKNCQNVFEFRCVDEWASAHCGDDELRSKKEGICTTCIKFRCEACQGLFDPDEESWCKEGICKGCEESRCECSCSACEELGPSINPQSGRHCRYCGEYLCYSHVGYDGCVNWT